MTNHQGNTPNTQIKIQIPKERHEFSGVDYVSSNVTSSRPGATLYIFENNGAVIKVIIKGRSPTMRHVSRTHRVALDWLCDRTNLDSTIHIKYVDSKNQLADSPLMNGIILCLFNISKFSSASCPQTMMKRTQARTREERSVGKSQPMMNWVSKTVPGSSTALSSSASSRPGELKATSHCLVLMASTGRLVAVDSKENDAASSSQVWQTGQN